MRAFSLSAPDHAPSYGERLAQVGKRKTLDTITRPGMADVGGIIAQGHAQRLECLCCGYTCEPQIVARQTIGGDHYERLRCKDGWGHFRRIWVGGYR